MIVQYIRKIKIHISCARQNYLVYSYVKERRQYVKYFNVGVTIVKLVNSLLSIK